MHRTTGHTVEPKGVIARARAKIHDRIGGHPEPSYLPPLGPAETRALLDHRARRDLNMSADEFTKKLRDGELPDTSVVHGLSMLVGEDLRSGTRTR